MRIGLVNEFFPPHAPGGAEWSMYRLGEALVERGHHVTVITPNYGAAPYELMNGIHVYRFSFPKKMPVGRQLPGFIWHANLIFYLYSAIQIYRIAKREHLELLHAQNKYSLPGTFFAARLLDLPIVGAIRDTSNICRIAVCLHHHDSVPLDCGLRKLLRECSEEYYENYCKNKSGWQHTKNKIWQIYHWFDVHLRRFFLNRVDAVVGMSNGILTVHERWHVFQNPNVLRKAIYNYVNLREPISEERKQEIRKRYGLNSDSKVILYVGRYTRGKGGPDFVQAAKILSNRFQNVEFVMVGTGGLDDTIGGKLHTLPELAREEVALTYQIANVVVVPSITQEALSRVILEALATSKPVVGTWVGGTPEAIRDGENGFLVPRSNPKQLAEAIQKILDDETLELKMGKRSLEIARGSFTKAVIVQEMGLLYTQVLQKKKGAG